MNHGEIVQLGTGQEIYRDPVSRYVADFIGEANLISGIAISRGGVRVGETILSVDTTAQLDGNVSLMVRPPDIRIGMPDTQSSSAISLTGTLRDRVFAGHRWRLFVELPTGQEITVEPDLDHGMDSLAIGGDVRLWWPRDRCRVLAQ
jgi:spermidine/putrescine transport system ATP-binding protein